MDTNTFHQIQELSRITVAELRENCLELFGEATRSFHKDFLRKWIAWRIQARAEGTLSERARRRAEELADDADLRVRTPRDPVKCGRLPDMERSTVTHLPIVCDPRLPPPGTFLTREFKGRNIVVKVLDSGFEYQGRQYKSLSSKASATRAGSACRSATMTADFPAATWTGRPAQLGGSIVFAQDHKGPRSNPGNRHAAHRGHRPLVPPTQNVEGFKSRKIVGKNSKLVACRFDDVLGLLATRIRLSR